MSGIIIGSGGTVITKLMETTGTVIKFSPSKERYPGTQDRVCVIAGAIPEICNALTHIFDRLSESDHLRTDGVKECLRHLKILVSNIASGMVIGKSGHTIKSIQQQCSVKIQISSKDESGASERMLSIFGDPNAIVRAVELVLEHTKEDPDAARWKKMVAYPSIKPGSSAHDLANSSGIGKSSGAALAMSNSLGAAMGGGGVGNFTSGTAFHSMLQHPGYAALSRGTQADASGSSMNQVLLSYAYVQSLMSSNPLYGQYNPIMVDGVNLTIPGATLATFEVAVPEVLVSSVFGPSGQLLADLIQSTGTRMQLSSKGDYIPGTFNRKLTITGPVLSVQAAHIIVLQHILKEQEMMRMQGHV